MPYPNEHSCRLEDPNKYDRFRREKCGQKHEDKCIDVIYGIKDGKSETQALRYKTDIWDEDDAREHCKERGGRFEPAKDEEENKAMENYESLTGERELRMFGLDSLELRAVEENGERRLVGHGAVYDKWSVDLGGFTELFEQGTFGESLKRDDIRSLRDHNGSYILGRSKAGTLTLEEDKKGVRFEVLLPDTSYANDLVVSVERRDITGCSIMFKSEVEQWLVDSKEVEFIDALMAMWDEKKHKVQRRVSHGQLFDIGPVTFPAYPQTDVKTRGMEAVLGLDYRALGTALVKSQRGLPLEESENKLLAKAGDMINRSAPGKEPDGKGARDGVAARLEMDRMALRWGKPKIKNKR